ncbi:hydroxyethylthiazole kinase [Anaerocolumna sp. AGMB13025]|uniref:hydroxyethylthiazole kinase n=1 Tax=Anaerocolumna sp. AGMB13025 TaxID=3039116 RepID=UPI00241E858B|nr:hydroxyethylthiazole kinase [Anaerocolumna sp. AGMB13025]WFR58527.1 hydroxyethylthiazole kinase [Anaerocolumna sp. AGMB13025]
MEHLKEILENVRESAPLIHNITNYVTVNDCANILLACGASPIMADDGKEVEEITAICNGLVINIGTLNERTVEAMIKAGKKANELNHPVILDPVGAGASALRTETTKRLLQEIKFTAIRGNISEIMTVYKGSGSTKGVDADSADRVTENNIKETLRFAKALSEETGAIIAITGAIDIVADAERAYIIRNGHPMMSKITGTGCMLTAIMGAFLAANSDLLLKAAAASVCAMGICGELAYLKITETKGGTASLKMYLIDSMSELTGDTLANRASITEVTELE